MSNTVQAPGIQLQHADRLMTETGSELRLYGGSFPFIWTLEVYLEEEIVSPTESNWFITLHIISQGAHQRVFKSSTVEIIPDQVTYIPFPHPEEPVAPVSDYGIKTCTPHAWDGQTSIQSSIAVQLSTPHNASPFVHIVNTEVETCWLIGVRHIVLTDPPLRTANTPGN